MGITPPPVGIADSLFTKVQQRVLGIVFAQPNRSYQWAELIRLARSGTGAVHRELTRLAESGLVSVEKIGSQKFYRANHESPVFPELHRLVIKTVGLTTPLYEALAPLKKHIRAAFVYGSFAKRSETAKSDVDLMVIAQRLDYPALYDVLIPAEKLLQRPINPHLMTPADWKWKVEKGNAFVRKVNAQPKIFVIGSDDDISRSDQSESKRPNQGRSS
jgi:predicted nucleotidyltransferase